MGAVGKEQRSTDEEPRLLLPLHTVRFMNEQRCTARWSTLSSSSSCRLQLYRAGSGGPRSDIISRLRRTIGSFKP